jgi:hypothetical protein
VGTYLVDNKSMIQRDEEIYSSTSIEKVKVVGQNPSLLTCLLTTYDTTASPFEIKRGRGEQLIRITLFICLSDSKKASWADTLIAI